jgi:chloramphenicol 3-O-phosphotransferase
MLKDRTAFHANQTGVLHRHGDVMIQRIDRLPSQARHRDGATLAHGEVTGHSHRFAQPDTVQLWEQGRNLFVEVIAPLAALVHEEHHQIDLPQGFYRFWKQREYRPDAYVDVED